MIKKKCLLFVFGYFYLNAQSISLRGNVKDSTQTPLTYANVIAKSTDVSKTLKFAITNLELIT